MLAIVAAVFLVAVSACAGAGSTPPATTAAHTPSTTPTTSAARTNPGPLAGYTPRQVRAYREALAAFNESQAVHARIFASGRATQHALAQLRSVEFDASSDWSLLKTLAAAHYTLTGYAFPISRARPDRVLLAKNGSGSVTITMCADPRGLREHYPNGRILRPPGNDKPYRQVVVMSRFPGGPWKGSTGKKLGPC